MRASWGEVGVRQRAENQRSYALKSIILSGLRGNHPRLLDMKESFLFIWSDLLIISLTEMFKAVFKVIAWRWAWQPTPVFLSGESMDRGAWWATVHGVAKSRTQLNDFPFHFKFIEGIDVRVWCKITSLEEVWWTDFMMSPMIPISWCSCLISSSSLLLLLLLSHFSRVQLCATPQTAAHQAPPSLGFSRQEHWSGLPFPSPILTPECALIIWLASKRHFMAKSDGILVFGLCYVTQFNSIKWTLSCQQTHSRVLVSSMNLKKQPESYSHEAMNSANILTERGSGPLPSLASRREPSSNQPLDYSLFKNLTQMFPDS